MPNSFSQNATKKLVAGKVVPAAWFALDPSRLRTIVASTPRIQELKVANTDMRFSRVKHPLLSSINFGRVMGADQQTSGPLIDGTDQEILKDTANPALRWLQPLIIKARALSATDADAFRVSTEGLDENGQPVFVAVLTIPLQTLSNKLAHSRAKSQNSSTSAPITTKDIPITPEECVLQITYNTASQVERLEINGTITSDGKKAEFRLRGAAVPLTFDALTAVGENGLTVKVLARFDAYEPVTSQDFRVLNKILPLPRKVDLRREQIEALKIARVDNTTIKLHALKNRGALLENLLVRPSKPSAPSKPRFVKTRQIVTFEFGFEIDPVRQARHLVIEKDGQASRLRPTNLPWSGHVPVPPSQPFRRLGPNELNLSEDLHARVSVYESLLELGRYLIVPARYVVTREPKSGRAALSAQTLTDPENPEENWVIFNIGMGPDVNAVEALTLEYAIAERIAGQMAQGHDPYPFYMEYPSETSLPISLQWPDTLADVFEPVIDGKNLILSLRAKSMTSAAAIFDALADQHAFLSGRFDLELAANQKLQISMIATLHETCGPTLHLKPIENEPTQYEAIDLIGYDQDLSEIALAAVMDLERSQVAPPALVPADGNMRVSGPTFQDGSRLATHATAQLPERLEVDSRRYDIGTVLATLLLSTQLQPSAPIGSTGEIARQIVFDVKAEGLGETSHVISIKEEGSEAVFMPFVLSWNLSLERYLRSEERTLQFRARISMMSGLEVETDWETRNYGNNPNIQLDRDVVIKKIVGATV